VQVSHIVLSLFSSLLPYPSAALLLLNIGRRYNG
jgi:hypothetical protein